MGKTEKTGLGRALVKQHTNMILQSKEKGRLYKSQLKNVLESITDVNDIDAVIQEAEESDRLLTAAASSATTPHISLDTNSVGDMTLEERKKEEELHAGSLQVPRRPPWTADMKVEELDANEQRSFLVWRRKLAALEDNDKLVLTPFEKNLDIWRQLWRVVERSDLLVMVVDARDPLFYRCPDLEAYAREVDEHKRTLLLVNKADLLPLSVRQKWAEYFMHHEILYVFWSAKAASAALDVKTLDDPGSEQHVQEKVDDDPPHTKIYGRDELLTRLQSEAEEIVKVRMESSSSSRGPSSRAANSPRNVVVGFVGYPNVGKSSTINALVGQKRTGVTSTPGKTKHFQTLIMSDELMLCDCPGLVFPSFSSSRYEMVASGVLPIDRMTEHREAVQVVANRVPRHLIEAVYKIKLPKPKPYEPQSRPPLASELLRSYCASRGWVASSGLPDETRAARLILKDYLEGKLPHYELPPGMSDMEETFVDKTGPSSLELHSDSDESDVEEMVDANVETVPGLEHMMDHLNSFEMENGLTAKKVTSKKANAPHKQHKKPPRKKDRSWRIGKGNEDGDGMPSVRVFQKSTNTGPSR